MKLEIIKNPEIKAKFQIGDYIVNGTHSFIIEDIDYCDKLQDFNISIKYSNCYGKGNKCVTNVAYQSKASRCWYCGIEYWRKK